MNINTSISASIACALAVGTLLFVLPSTSGPSDRTSRSEVALSVSPGALSVATARGLRDAGMTGNTGAILAEDISYVRRAPPST